MVFTRTQIPTPKQSSDEVVILAPDGDIPTAVGRHLIAKYHLPDEWEKQYITILPPNSVKSLQSRINPQFSKWKHLRAVRLTGITEESILEEIDRRLKRRFLKIPANPDAPQGVYREGMTLAEFLKENAVALAQKTAHLRP